MNKNLLKITSILCSFSILPSVSLALQEKTKNYSKGGSTTATLEQDGKTGMGVWISTGEPYVITSTTNADGTITGSSKFNEGGENTTTITGTRAQISSSGKINQYPPNGVDLYDSSSTITNSSGTTVANGSTTKNNEEIITTTITGTGTKGITSTAERKKGSGAKRTVTGKDGNTITTTNDGDTSRTVSANNGTTKTTTKKTSTKSGTN